MPLRLMLVFVSALVAAVASSSADSASDFQYWYEKQFVDNVTHLVGLPSDTVRNFLAAEPSASARELPCNGAPSLQTRSSVRASANNGCSALLTSWGVSCTCLPSYATQRSVWEFVVKRKVPGKTSSAPVVATSAADVLEIDVIESLFVPLDLERLCVCHLLVLSWSIVTREVAHITHVVGLTDCVRTCMLY